MRIQQIGVVAAVMCVIVALCAANAPQEAMHQETRAMTPEEVAAAVTSLATILRDGYVFPDVGERMAADITTRLKRGDYRAINTEETLAERLTEDLRTISRDKHLGVVYRPPTAEGRTRRGPDVHEIRRENYGFKKVEHLEGNIGYLRFDIFIPEEEAKQIASAALAFLARCDALIIDLRHNGGGSPDMIRYITSYFFDSPTLLNVMLNREGEVVNEYYTLDTVPGRRFSNDVPIYVLTSSYTFSGAEEFSYNLKNLKRATIVGETTGGGAHPVRGERINERLMVRVPFMRAQNPISKTNWEGTGVEPDIIISSEEALDRAILEAKRTIATRHE